ncbi:AfsR/SARP family transcriptional regulator [Actinoalloteichus hymeniacidonis]|uniref:DNA-binding transcriptional activator of the SARP family n=1 Tax=Actinoalloteichus hymeniacidonis TaxID=340345 RepID=A0AAC9HSP2_9PSEU|nr:BTAD domain-containing putative transcriptional regulator [Actinoalloteichus hymeniacidonis]AOS64645.1 DNA-binding transcriptional activator of the SARP family [Actinoalloteichus hymeniacidonis]MBB5907281.1 DNA-binding SARP family transcriptional activator [Actinoalloteichus hymeniacidonis]
MSLRFSLLGPVRAWRNEDEIPLGPRQQRAILAALLLNNRIRLSVGQLIGMVWDDPTPSAVMAVRTYVYKLRKLLPELDLTAKDGGYTIRTEIVDDEAGEPLEGLHSRYFDAQRLRLAQRGLKAKEDRLERELNTLELQRHVDEHPLREHPRALLMHTLYRDGRQAEALDQFHEARVLFAAELGIEPGPELREVHQAILDGTLKHVAKPDQLPLDFAEFTGRAREIAQLVAALPGPVGITGMQGSGKTSLAVRVAHAVKHDYPDGWFFVRGANVVDDLLRAVGVESASGDKAALWREKARGKRFLVVLDDIECAEQVHDLATPGSALIVTSVRRLNGIPGMTWVKIAGLESGEAREFFRALLGDARFDAELTQAEELLDRASCLPGPIRVAGSKLAARPHWTIDMLLQQADLGYRMGESIPSDCGAVLNPLAKAAQRLADHERRLLLVFAERGAKEITSMEATALSGCGLGVIEMTLEALADVHLIDPVVRGRYRLPTFVRSYFGATAATLA